MTRKISLTIEIVHAPLLEEEALPALEAARAGGSGALLVRAARSALPRLAARVPEGAAHEPSVIAWKLAVARLEAVLATAPEPPRTEAAFEEVAWALLHAARAAEPVSLGEDWDLLRVLIDPARRRGEGLGGLGSTLAGAALAGSGPLASASGFALFRDRSYATGWNGPERVSNVTRSLRRFTPERLEVLAGEIPVAVARTIWPRRTSPVARRLSRAVAAMARLQDAYTTASREKAGVFIELELD